MSILTLTEAKDHLRVSVSTDDDLIQIYIEAAENYIGKYLNSENFSVEPAIKAAALLLVADLYEVRSASIVGTIYNKNPTVENLLHPHRVGLGI